MNSTGLKIKQIRKSKGLSQQLVADSAGITQSSLALIESGKTKNISVEVGKGITEALGISFHELFNIESSEIKNHNELTVTLLINYVFAVLSHYSLLMQLSAHEELSVDEQRNYGSQLNNLRDGIYKTFKTYKEKGFVDNDIITTVLEAYPSFNTWQRLLEPVKKLID